MPLIPVMIVEDEFLVRVGLKSMVAWEKLGFSVVADAANGERALELYKIHRPYLILTDIRMTPMDGLEMMRRIRETDEEAKFIVISAYEEFEYARQAIRYGVELYLNKSCFTAEELEGALKRLAASYRRPAPANAREQETTDIASALPPPAKPELLNQWFADNALSQLPKWVAACRQDRAAEHDVLPDALLAMAKDIFNKEGFVTRFFIKDRFLVLLVGSTDFDMVEAALRHLIDTISQYFSSALYVGISARFVNPGYVYQALSDACKTCNDFLFDKAVTLRTYQRDSADSAFDKQLTRMCGELEQRLYAADEGGLSESVASIIAMSRNYRMLERAVFSVILVLERFDRSILVSAAFDDVMSDDLRAIGQALTLWAGKLMKARREPAQRDPIDEVIEYIGAHLTEDISLVRMAQLYFFTPNYLGQLFRQKTGVYYNAYVTNLRINRACELLLGTESPVSEIGRMVGIDDPHYFSRIFRERMGVSPNKYRRKWYE